MSEAVWVGVRGRAEANGAGDTLPLLADARVVRDTVGPDVQDRPSSAREGRRAGCATRAVLGRRGRRRTTSQAFAPVLIYFLSHFS